MTRFDGDEPKEDTAGLDDVIDSDDEAVRVNRLTLSLLADYVGRDVVFGHDVPGETRDALAAAYEALDEPGVPLSFHDCPQDGASLEPLGDVSNPSEQIERLECPKCGGVYALDRDTGELEVVE